MSISYHDSNTRMSQLTIHNGTVYLAGQVPTDATADMRGQTEQVLARIDELPGRPPVRAAVEAKLARPEWKVEIMVTAALPEA